MKHAKSKIKPIKIGKQPGTTYCFLEKVKMINKVLTEKSNKSRFLKQKIN